MKNFVYILFIFLFSCSKFNINYDYIYLSKDKNLDCILNLQTDNLLETDDLILKLTIKNKLNEEIYIEPAMINLVSGNGFISTPYYANYNNFIVNKNETKNFLFKFKPINDYISYNLIKESGEFNDNYSLYVNFIFDKTGGLLFDTNIIFKANKKDFEKYKNIYAIKNKIKIYDLDFNNVELVSNIIKYYYEIFPEKEHHHDEKEKMHTQLPPTVIISGYEIIIGGYLFKIVPYIKGNNHIIYFKIVDKEVNPLKIKSDEILIEYKNKIYKPINNFSKINIKTNDYELILYQNQRFEFKFIYNIPIDKNEKQINLILDGIKVGNNEKVFRNTMKYILQN